MTATFTTTIMVPMETKTTTTMQIDTTKTATLTTIGTTTTVTGGKKEINARDFHERRKVHIFLPIYD